MIEDLRFRRAPTVGWHWLNALSNTVRPTIKLHKKELSMRTLQMFVSRALAFLYDCRGVSTVEYALIVVAIIGIVGVGAGLLTDAFEGLFGDLADQMADAADDVAGDVNTATGP